MQCSYTLLLSNESFRFWFDHIILKVWLDSSALTQFWAILSQSRVVCGEGRGRAEFGGRGRVGKGEKEKGVILWQEAISTVKSQLLNSMFFFQLCTTFFYKWNGIVFLHYLIFKTLSFILIWNTIRKLYHLITKKDNNWWMYKDKILL